VAADTVTFAYNGIGDGIRILTRSGAAHARCAVPDENEQRMNTL
jgi:hypothetical protein